HHGRRRQLQGRSPHLENRRRGPGAGLQRLAGVCGAEGDGGEIRLPSPRPIGGEGVRCGIVASVRTTCSKSASPCTTPTTSSAGCRIYRLCSAPWKGGADLKCETLTSPTTQPFPCPGSPTKKSACP